MTDYYTRRCALVTCRQLSMSMEPVNRMDFLKSAVTAVAVAGVAAAPALAEIDNPVVPFLGGGDKVRTMSMHCMIIWARK